MKKIGLGIAIILYAILLEVSIGGLAYIVWGIGTVGLILAIAGYLNNKDE